MKKDVLRYLIQSLFALLLLFIGCNTGGTHTQVSINLGFSHNNNSSVTESSVTEIVEKVLRLFTADAYALPPTGIESISLTVTGTGMSSLTRVYDISSDTIVIEVESGPARVFTVDGLDASKNILYSGNSIPVECVAGNTLDVSITMERVAASIAVTASSGYIMTGETQQYTATATYADTTSADISSLVEWSSSDTGVATIDPAGLASGVARGTTNISALHRGVSSNSIALDVYSSWGKIYVANQADDTVSVIDGQTNTVSTTIDIGDGPGGVADAPCGVGANSTTLKVYISDVQSANVSVIDSITDAVSNTIDIVDSSGSSDHFDVGVNPNTNKVYVAKFYAADEIAVINGTTDAVSLYIDSTSPINYDNYPSGIGVNSITNKIYSPLWGEVIVINGASDTINGLVTGAAWNNPYGVGVNSGTNMVYVSNNSGSDIQVINGSTDSFVKSLTVGTNPWGVEVNINSNKIYVANNGSGTVSVIDGSTDSVISGTGYPIIVGTNPKGVSVHPYSNRVYVTNNNGGGSGSVTVIDGSTDTVITTIPVGNSPAFLDIIY